MAFTWKKHVSQTFSDTQPLILLSDNENDYFALNTNTSFTLDIPLQDQKHPNSSLTLDARDSRIPLFWYGDVALLNGTLNVLAKQQLYLASASMGPNNFQSAANFNVTAQGLGIGISGGSRGTAEYLGSSITSVNVSFFDMFTSQLLLKGSASMTVVTEALTHWGSQVTVMDDATLAITFATANLQENTVAGYTLGSSGKTDSVTATVEFIGRFDLPDSNVNIPQGFFNFATKDQYGTTITNEGEFIFQVGGNLATAYREGIKMMGDLLFAIDGIPTNDPNALKITPEEGRFTIYLG